MQMVAPLPGRAAKPTSMENQNDMDSFFSAMQALGKK